MEAILLGWVQSLIGPVSRFFTNLRCLSIDGPNPELHTDDLGRNVRLRLSTKGIKTVNKYGGIDAAAKKFGVNLASY